MDPLNLFFVLLFILIGGVFSASEMALVSLRSSQIDEMARKSKGGAAVKRLTENSNRFLSAVQIGVTVAGFFSASFGAAQIAPAVSPLLQDLGLGASAASTVAFVGVTIIIAYLSIIFGELVPKRIAMQSAEAIALLVVRPLSAITWLLRPVIWFLGVSTDLVLRLLGRDPKEQREAMSTAELRAFMSAQDMITPAERNMVVDMLSVGDRQVQEVMTPRTEVEFFAADTPVSQVRREVSKLEHSRYPVRGGMSDDDVVGFIHIRDLIAPPASVSTIGDLVRPIMSFPTGKLVLEALTEMRGAHEHLALIIDEYGGVDGIVTLEDVLEEFVGEIRDEYDRETPKVVSKGDKREISGLANRAEVEKVLGEGLPDGPFDTIAGFVVDELGHMPEIGDEVRWDDFVLKVAAMDGRRIEWLTVSQVPQDTLDQMVEEQE
ncbi:hemolysin family protein [Actinomycetaceae bacterium L2_0104]